MAWERISRAWPRLAATASLQFGNKHDSSPQYRSLQEGDGLLNVLILGHDTGQQCDGTGAVVAGPVLLAHIESHLTTGFLLGEEEAIGSLGNTWPVLGNVSLALSWVWLCRASGGNEDGNLLGHALLAKQVGVKVSDCSLALIASWGSQVESTGEANDGSEDEELHGECVDSVTESPYVLCVDT